METEIDDINEETKAPNAEQKEQRNEQIDQPDKGRGDVEPKPGTTGTPCANCGKDVPWRGQGRKGKFCKPECKREFRKNARKGAQEAAHKASGRASVQGKAKAFGYRGERKGKAAEEDDEKTVLPWRRPIEEIDADAKRTLEMAYDYVWKGVVKLCEKLPDHWVGAPDEELETPFRASHVQGDIEDKESLSFRAISWLMKGAVIVSAVRNRKPKEPTNVTPGGGIDP